MADDERRGVHTIGKFEVLFRMCRGGMADIYRCRLRGIGGFEKTVVVKRIRADRQSDPLFVGMFLDEARLAANLSHPNIVQVFEIGEADGAPYIAMELVDGPSLATLMRQVRQAGGLQPPHLGHLVRIVSDVCAGLHEAHNARGSDGQLLGLVHRDVSPQNIVVSRQGVAKLLDFGVAKARGRLTETQAGTLKGKLRYMAPEQLAGIVDQRMDVFAAGVCLFEATCGRSPYGSDTAEDIALFKSIADGRYARPSELVADYPPELEEIVLSAIEPEPDRRCPSAGVLHERLEAFLAAEPFRSSARAVAAWIQQLSSAAPDPTAGGDPMRAASAQMTVARPSDRAGGPGGPILALSAITASVDSGPSLRSSSRSSSRSPLQASLFWPAARSWSAAVGRRTRLVIAGLTLVAAAGLAGVLLRSAAPEHPGGTVAAGYLQAAEDLAAGRQYRSAQELLQRARAMGAMDPTLSPRFARLAAQLAHEVPPERAIARADGEPAAATMPARADGMPTAATEPATASTDGESAAATVPAIASTDGVPAAAASSPAPIGRRRAGRRAPTRFVVASIDRPPARGPLTAAPAVPVPVRPAGSAPAPSGITSNVSPASPLLAAKQPLAAAGGSAIRCPAGPPGVIRSRRPLSPVPPPRLPRLTRGGSGAARRTLAVVEAESLKAGCSPDFVQGITGALARALLDQGDREIHPSAIYYFIVREAGLGSDRESAARALASAHLSGAIKALAGLPIQEGDRLAAHDSP